MISWRGASRARGEVLVQWDRDRFHLRESLCECCKASNPHPFDPSGVGHEEAAPATGLELSTAEEALAYLKPQVLEEGRKGRYHVRPDLRELVESEGGPIGT